MVPETENFFCVVVNHPTSLGHLKRFIATIKKAHAKPLFKHPDVLAHCGLRQMHLLGRSGKPARLNDGDEDSELLVHE